MSTQDIAAPARPAPDSSTTQDMPAGGNGLLTANLMCMGSIVIWAAALPAADFLIGRVPTLALTAMRMSIAGLCLLPIWWLMEGSRTILRAPWPAGLGVGGLFALSGLFLVISQGLSDAVTVAVVSALLPIIGMGLEILFDGRRLSRALIIGSLLSISGGIIACATPLDSFGFGLGALIALLSNLCYAFGSRFAVTALPGMTPLGRASLSLVGAGITATVALGLQAATVGTGEWGHFGTQQAIALAVFAVGGMAICQVLWLASIGRLGVGVAALYMNSSAFFVMLFSWMLGGAWSWLQVAGAAVVAFGVLIAQGVIKLGAVREARAE